MNGIPLERANDELERIAVDARVIVDGLRPRALLYNRGCEPLARIAPLESSAAKRHGVTLFPDLIVSTARAEEETQLRQEFIVRDREVVYFAKPTDPLVDQLAVRLDGIRWGIAEMLIKVRNRQFNEYDGLARGTTEALKHPAYAGKNIKLRWKIVPTFPAWLEALLNDRLKVA